MRQRVLEYEGPAEPLGFGRIAGRFGEGGEATVRDGKSLDAERLEPDVAPALAILRDQWRTRTDVGASAVEPYDLRFLAFDSLLPRLRRQIDSSSLGPVSLP